MATDAAAEGLNLQARCRFVVHIDLPWSPTTLAQRVGRVDRIGQARPVRVWQLAGAGGTRASGRRGAGAPLSAHPQPTWEVLIPREWAQVGPRRPRVWIPTTGTPRVATNDLADTADAIATSPRS